MKKSILGAALGNCVHVAGLHHFLMIAESEGYQTSSLGPAVSIERLVKAIQDVHPTIIAVSYRLTPEVAAELFETLRSRLENLGMQSTRMVFGGTVPVCLIAQKSGLFERVFDGHDSVENIKAFLRGEVDRSAIQKPMTDLIGRIEQKYPYPLLRHHYGRPTLEETIEGVKTIAEAGVLDVISLGTDQNAQEHFFRSEEMDHAQDGAGGVPVRTSEQLREIFVASRCGNFPLIRCYSGTRDLIPWAEMSVDTIHNAWGAIPLCWYCVIDGRSQLSLYDSIREKQAAMHWYAERNIPVEVNESHQWSLRDAHDSLGVAMAFLAAYNAKKAGVKNYVSQFMFNTPPGTSPVNDLAKMLAKKELIESLHDDTFTSYREVRAGIAHFSSNPFTASGQLAASAVISLALKPHILHVVGHSEGHHATTASELIQSCNIIHGVLQNCLHGLPDMTFDKDVIARQYELISEAKTLLSAIKMFGAAVSDDPWSDAWVLSNAIKNGILDAPHFRGNPALCGKIITRCINGGWYAIDESSGNPITEQNRLKLVLDSTLVLSANQNNSSI